MDPPTGQREGLKMNGVYGLERLVELADTTFNAAIETEAYD